MYCIHWVKVNLTLLPLVNQSQSYIPTNKSNYKVTATLKICYKKFFTKNKNVYVNK